jgi:Na+/proline symporter
MSLGAGLGHTAYLAALVALGVYFGRRTFQTRMHGAVERVAATATATATATASTTERA